MFANFVTWWTNNPVVRWITYIFLFLIGWEAVKRHLKEAGRQAERQANAERAAKMETKVIKTITENSNAMVRQSDAVRARPSAEQLPDGSASLAPHNYRD